MHACKERRHFLEHLEEYKAKKSHPGKTLEQHCRGVLKDFDRLCRFSGIAGETLIEAGHYLTYYHDIGKLDSAWSIDNEKRPPHSPKSLEFLRQWRANFSTKPRLTTLLWYFVLRHHGKLKPVEKIEPSGGVQNFICDVLGKPSYRKIVKQEDPVGLGDIFGLFKIADALSALEVEAEDSAQKIRQQMIKEPRYGREKIKLMIEDVSEERWREQLKIAKLPDIGMLRAPTGWGKTTVSLLFPQNKTCKRIFYLFPTITAINKFYEKMRKSFKGDVIKYFYFYDTEIKEDEEKLRTIFFIENFLSPIVITTVDQFLLSFLQCGKYNTKRVSFRNSAVILDEVHLLNPLMLRLFTYFFKTFRENYKMKLLLMSATLPKAYREYFSGEFDLPEDAFLDFGEEYAKKRRVIFDMHDEDIIDAVENIYRDFKNGRRVLVVVNTVEKAIEIGRKLREDVGEKNEKESIAVFHARFMYCHRKKKEDFVEERKRTPHVLIATQVCEVSLDVSYDVIYTEVAPIASIIQRFGRVNRYKERTNKINAHMFFPGELRDLETKRRYPYEEWETADCWNTLRELAGTLENEKQLIDRFDEVLPFTRLEEELSYCMDRANLDFWEDHLQMLYSLDVEEERLRNILGYRNIFTTLVIPSPELVSDRRVRQKVESLEKMVKKIAGLSFLERKKIFSTAKELSVPVPAWWLKKADVCSGVFPIITVGDVTYDVDYGVLKRKGAAIY